MNRRVIALAAALCAVGAAFAIPAAAAAAATPAHAAATAANCPHPNPYPPAPNAEVQASSTKPPVGAKIEVSGIRYCPNEDVTITIAGTFVGTGHTNASGTFDPQVTVPGPAGPKQLCGIGASGLPTDRDCLMLTVTGSGTSGGGSGSGSSGGGTAMTGVEIASLVAVAAVLLGAGIVFSRAGRRRKSTVAG